MHTADTLATAIAVGDDHAVADAIASGVDVNQIASTHSWPSLQLAIEHQRPSIVAQLLAAGAEVNRDLGDGWTALVHAIDIESDAAWQVHHETGRASTKLTEILLAWGAKPTAKAYEIALCYDNQEVIRLLDRARKL